MEHSRHVEQAHAGEREHDAANTSGSNPVRQVLGVGPADHVSRTSAMLLIVENEENNRRLIEQIVGFAGYRYVSVTNGLEALAALDRVPADLILIDLSMPVLDGYRTTERIRQRRDGGSVPIVAVTAHAMSDDRERALRSGFTDYLTKPFRPAELLGMVERMLHLGVHRPATPPTTPTVPSGGEQPC